MIEKIVIKKEKIEEAKIIYGNEMVYSAFDIIEKNRLCDIENLDIDDNIKKCISFILTKNLLI